ncbi:MAG: DUF3306 domain-containing protein [Xanthomonadaceae bacterium]|nr:DUF3306 domain-containing protein [Xanthomonadaceae bacterium]
MSEKVTQRSELAEEGEGFLSRWSRRSLQARRGELESELEPAPAVEPVAEASPQQEEPAVRIDPRTGKPYDELTDEDMPPIESLDANSDLSVFFAKNVSAALRMKALSKVFHSPAYNRYCLCAEYADDYTQFAPLGEVVPHDLKAAIAREARALRERLLARGKEITLEEAEARVRAEREAELPYITLTEEEKALARKAAEAEAERGVAEADAGERAEQDA